MFSAVCVCCCPLQQQVDLLAATAADKLPKMLAVLHRSGFTTHASMHRLFIFTQPGSTNTRQLTATHGFLFQSAL
jgi:hypothetical protein